MRAAAYDPGMIENSFFKLYITHLATAQLVDFRGWVTEFSDGFTSNWNTESVYGRMDPLVTFQNTQRQISIGFDVVSGDINQAHQNLNKINTLISFLYPVYETDARGIQNTLQAAPLLGMRWTNLIADVNDGSQLVGFLGGATYAPDLSQGGFISMNAYTKTETEWEKPTGHVDTGVSTSEEVETVDYMKTRRGSEGLFVPKVVSLNLNFTVLHKHLTGWSRAGGKFKFGKEGALFPNANKAVIPGSRSDQTTIYQSGENPLDLVGDPGPSVKSSAEDEVLGTGGKP
jgi:hypothetical protein